MKHRFSQDKRVITANGHVSPARVAAVEALEAQGRDGATAEEMVLLIGNDLPGKRPLGSLGQVLSYMQTDELVVLVGDRWYLKEYAPQPPAEKSHSSGPAPYATNGQRAQIAPMVQKRSGKTISIYRTPVVYNEAIAVSMLIAQRWYKVPFFGSLRICIGLEAPNWSPEQEMYTDVEVLKITHKNGRTSEERPAPKDIVTIAAEE